MFQPGGPTFLELARQALASTEEGYDLLAPKFDLTPFRTPDNVLDASRAELKKEGPFDSGLDLCCGTGAATRAVLDPLCRERVVGVDLSQGMLDVARRLDPDEGKRTEFVRGDALDLPWENAFDLAVCFGALGHIPREEEARFLAGVHRALRPGGCFAFVTATRPSPATTLSWWLLHGFNLGMRVRNALVHPPFIMYYLTFLWPEVRRPLGQAGFTEMEATPLPSNGQGPDHLLLVTARKPPSP